MSNKLIPWLQSDMAERILAIAIGIAVVLVLSQLAKRALARTIKSNENRYKARKAANLLTYTFLVIVVLFVYSDKLGHVGVALGVTGAGIAFALQEVIVSLAGWLSIMLSGNVSVGQRVKIGNVKGDIIDIGILSTTIMEMGDWVDGDLFNGRIVTLANSFVFKEQLHNYSAEYPFLWDEIRIPIRSESDVEKARSICYEILTEVTGSYAEQSKEKWQKLAVKYRVEAAQVEPMVSMTFDENWVTFTLRYIVDFKRRRTTKDQIFTAILERIKKEPSIEIAASTLEVTNVSEEP